MIHKYRAIWTGAEWSATAGIAPSVESAIRLLANHAGQIVCIPTGDVVATVARKPSKACADFLADELQSRNCVGW